MKPNKLIVGVLTYEIRYVDFVDAQNSCGECEDTTGVIKIKKGMPEDFTRDTIFHECLHATNHSWSESEVVGATRLLLMVCRDNPWLKDVLFPRQK